MDAAALPRPAHAGAGIALGPEGAHVDASGLSVPTLASERLSLRLTRAGRPGSATVLGSATPTVGGAEVRSERGEGIVEWWRSLPAGLEHGVTLERRPRGVGPLHLDVDVEGATVAGRSDDAIALLDPTGAIELGRYEGLVVIDARGARIPARLGPAGSGAIRIEVDDERARYPLVVDPLLRLVHEATLDDAALGTSTSFGASVSVSTAGDLVLVGAPDASSGSLLLTGAGRAFARTGTTWAPGEALGSGLVGGSRFGLLVGLRPDGTGAVSVGASTLWYLGRSGTSWLDAATLPVSNVRALAVADDRAAYVSGTSLFVISLGATLVPEPIAPLDPFRPGRGDSLAFSPDGAHLLVGCDNESRALLLSRATGTWQLEAELLPMTGLPGDMNVRGVALSTDRAFVSGSEVTTIFRESGGTWSRAGSVPCGVTSVQATDASSDGTVLAAGSCVLVDEGGTWTAIGDLPGTRLAVAANGSRVVAAELATASVDVARLEAPLENGAACDASWDCRSGHCADGVCCGAACDAPCTSCRARDTGGADGTCAPVRAGDDPAGDCTVDPSRCRGGSCDGAGACTMLGDGTECRGASGACDVAETCVAGICPADDLAGVGTICRAGADVCDAIETCDGTSAACPTDAFLSGRECRPAAGGCDVAESCFGTSAACPPDAFLAAGIACRVSTDPSCDPAEVCDGASVTCPTDVTGCAAGPDASGTDGGSADDAGGAVPASAGCGCRVTGRPLGAPALAAWLLLVSSRPRARRGCARRRRSRP